MQFSDGSNSLGMVEDVDFFCDSDSSSYPTAQKTRNMNQWYLRAVALQIMSNRTWRSGDKNLSTLPEATTDLGDGQDDYTLPTDFLRLQRVEVKNSGGDFVRLKPISLEDIENSFSEYEETDGLPHSYAKVGNVIRLKPGPAASSVTTSDGLKIYYSRDPDLFAATDTAQTPSLPSPFHRFISLGAAYDWLIVNGPADRADRIRLELQIAEKELKKFVSDLDEQVHNSFRRDHSTRNYE